MQMQIEKNISHSFEIVNVLTAEFHKVDYSMLIIGPLYYPWLNKPVLGYKMCLALNM